MKTVLVLLALIFVVSCGPSKEEIAIEKQRVIDSVNSVVQKAELQKKLDEEKELRIKAEETARQNQEMAASRSRENNTYSNVNRQNNNVVKNDVQEINNNPLKCLSFQVSNQNRGAFMKDRLIVSIINTDNSRKIANIRFRVNSYAVTGAKLSSHEEMIYDFVNPQTTYNRMIDYDQFHSESKSYKVVFLSAQFAK